MGRLTLKEVGGLRKHSNTQAEYDNEVAYDLLCHKLKKIEEIVKDDKKSVCYLMGMGAHSKSTYKELENEKGIEVVWYNSVLPKYIRFFSGVIASYAGLIKVYDPEKLSSTFLKLVESSMAGVYLFDSSRESGFVKAVISNLLPEEYDFTVKDDAGYFYYIVDADNVESSTGIYEIVSYGVDSQKVAEYF